MWEIVQGTKGPPPACRVRSCSFLAWEPWVGRVLGGQDMGSEEGRGLPKNQLFHKPGHSLEL